MDSWRRRLLALGAFDLGPPPPPPHAIARCREVCLADVPVVTHLHGTELLMLEQIDQYIKVTGSRIELPASWTYAEYWAERLRATAQRSTHPLAVSTDHAARAVRTLGVAEDRLTVVPNGVDTERFRRVDLTAQERLALLRQWLVDDPRGWDESGRQEASATPWPTCLPSLTPQVFCCMSVGSRR